MKGLKSRHREYTKGKEPRMKERKAPPFVLNVCMNTVEKERETGNSRCCSSYSTISKRIYPGETQHLASFVNFVSSYISPTPISWRNFIMRAGSLTS